MKVTGPRSLGDLLQSGDISQLRKEALVRRELAEEVRARLPEDQAAHVVSAHVADDGRLVVGVDSAAWAARLRYSTPELLGRTLRVQVTAPSAGGVPGLSR